MDEVGHQVLIGTEKANAFLRERARVIDEFQCYLSAGGGADQHQSSEMDKKLLRQKAAAHLNSLYTKAIGRESALPYKKVMEGKVLIGGLPEEVLPLRMPSHYGTKKLQSILACQEIEVVQVTEDTCTGTSVENSTGNQELMDVHLPDVSEEDTQILYPLLVSGERTSSPKCTSKRKPIAVKDELGQKRKKSSKRTRKVKNLPGEFYVEKICEMRQTSAGKEYLVKWTGYSEHENSWEPEDNLPRNLINSFLHSV